MMYRVNAGTIPPDSWIQDREIGGGRILGEVCHFVDYLTFLNGSLPVLVQAVAMDDPFGHQDTLSVSIRYANGSIGSIQYFANGSKELPKEYIEVYGHGVTAALKDFKELQVFSKGRPFKKKLLTQDKGQKEEVKQFIEAVRDGKEAPIPLEEIFSTSNACFAILESLRTWKFCNFEFLIFNFELRAAVSRIHRHIDSRVRISYTLYPMLATGSKISNHESCR